jgi:pimeloyl-ACP methyl ester carboxylesterase
MGGSAFQIEVGGSTEETIQTAADTIRARRTAARLLVPNSSIDVEVWGDEAGRLLRVSVPGQSLEVARDDVASVAARVVTVSRANDEQVRVQANGFSLAGTISKPGDAGARPLPAAILVAGSGGQDRDQTVFGIPLFGQLAGRLADAGFLVLRYDKRGIGQSGGRIESATLADYADDLRAAVRFLDQRKDVNRKQIAVIGHGEGGSMSMIAAAKEKKVAAVALLAASGVTGAELNIAQISRAVERAKRPEAERQSTLELQKKIQAAVLSGKGWDEIPPALRRQAEVPWFRSFLAFEPARQMLDVKQPVLIVHGLLDTQVPPSNADLLEKIARGRRRAGAVEVVKIPGVNHLLVPAVTGEFDEYATLKVKAVSEVVSDAIIGWLKKTVAVLR